MYDISENLDSNFIISKNKFDGSIMDKKNITLDLSKLQRPGTIQVT
jgi:hypothetical protein